MRYPVVVAVLLAAAPAPAQPVPDATELEKAVLAARSAIRSGYVEFTIASNFTFQGEPLAYRSERRTWFDGAKVRSDFEYVSGPDKGVKKRECLNCERDGWVALAMDIPGLVINYHPRGAPGRPEAREVIDPRCYGLHASIHATLSDRPLARTFDRPGAAPKTVATREIDGRTVYELGWTAPTKATIVYRIDPARGHSVTHVESVFATPKTVHKQSLAVDVTRIGDVWYPTKTVYTETQDGKHVRDETIDIKLFRPNVEVPPRTFTLAGLQFRPGSTVSTPGRPLAVIRPDGTLAPPLDGP